MIKKDRAIILRIDDFMETSLLVYAITKDNGILKFLAKGAKRVKSPLRMSFELFTESEIIFYYKQDREFNIIKEGRILNHFQKICEDYSKYELISRVSQYIIKNFPIGSGEEIYEELQSFLQFLETANRITPLLYTFFLIRNFQRQGVLPQFDLCNRCKERKANYLLSELKIPVCKKCLEAGEMALPIDEGTRAELNYILTRGWNELNNLKLREQTKKLLELICNEYEKTF